MPHTSLTPAKYAQQMKSAAKIDATPLADSPEDVDAPHESSTRVALDGGHADVDVFTDRIEVTIRLGGRSVLGIALSHMEAANLGLAIARPGGPTTGDLFALADAMHADPSALVKHWGTAEQETR